MKSIGVLAIALVAGLAAASPAAAKGAYSARYSGQSFHMSFGTVQAQQVRQRATRSPRYAKPAPVTRYGYRSGRRGAPAWAHPAWRRTAWPGYGRWGRYTWRAPIRHTPQGHRHR